jgi:DNA polymerase-3 subunit beta
LKISCSKAALVTGVQTVYKAVSPKATIPVLSGILVETCPEGLRLVAYDLDLGIETFVPVTVEREGSLVFPARYLSEITRKLPHSEVQMEYREDTKSVEILSDRISFNIKTMPADEFPSLPEISLSNAWSISEQDLRAMIRRTAIAAAMEDTRAFLTGVYVLMEPGKLTMVATDTFRLAHKTMDFPSPFAETKSVIIPAKTLLEVERNLMVDGEREVEMALTERHAMIKVGATTFVTRLLEGQFPNYKQVFPQNIPARVTLDRNQLLSSIDRVSLMCKDDLSAVKMVYTGDEGSSSGFLTISANTPEVGQATEDIPVSMQGYADITVALRARYLRDVLRVLEGEEVSLGYTSFKHPIEVKDETDPNFTYLVMPVTSAT